MYRDDSILKVSVIVTVYNGEKYIYNSLRSIINQTLKDIEIICIDDLSSDNTLNILRKFQNEDKRIKVISNQSNVGAGESRNQGLKTAKGEYVIFLDADDVFEENMLWEAYFKAKSCESDICIFKEDFFCENREQESSYLYLNNMLRMLGELNCFSPNEIKDTIFNLWNGWAWDKLYRREFIKRTNVYFQKMQTTNDAFFVHVSMINAKKISFVNKILVCCLYYI